MTDNISKIKSDREKLDLILQMLSGKDAADSSEAQKGTICDSAGQEFSYTVTLGWNHRYANRCDSEWRAFNLQLLDFIQRQKYSPEELTSVLLQSKFEDNHWEWLRKSVHLNDPRYFWHYFLVSDIPQGVCLCHFPETSEIDQAEIFYVDYLAVAPWNRTNVMCSKRFSGIGSILLRAAIAHARNAFHTEGGFSLHSLPQANSYYESIGMKMFSTKDKVGLKYYEMPKASAAAFTEGR